MSTNFVMRWIGPGFASGIGLGLWLKLLGQIRFRIGLPYLGRAATIAAGACFNSLGGLAEQLIYGRCIRTATIHPPVFVLGVARSGTTHLHTLLTQDTRFAFPNTFQTLNPHIFLWTESWLAPLEQILFPATRPMDNMLWSVDSPAEDEFAIMALSGLSPFASWLFPRNFERYDGYFDFSCTSPEERERWKETLLYFVKKMYCRYDKPLILKSPTHTPRVRMLLDLFPQAKFVLIHRHPYQVYRSLLSMTRKVLPIVSVQRWDRQALCDRTVNVYRLYLDAYFDQRHLIPEGHLAEVSFQQLEQSPLPTLRKIYEQLHLPSFDVAEPAITEYLAGIDGYRKNTHADIDPEMKSQLARAWSRSFEEWGYEP